MTLLFSLERYSEVVEAYIGGLEEYAAQGATDLSRVASVASFFVSRVDTEVDRRLERLAAKSADAQSAGGAEGLCGNRRRRAGPRGVPDLHRALHGGALGGACVQRGRGSSDCCGHPPPPRTPPTRTFSTSTG